MNTNVRRPVAFAAGLVATLFLCFTALAQTQSDTAAKQDDQVGPSYASRLFGNPSAAKQDLAHRSYELSSLFYDPKPRSCLVRIGQTKKSFQPVIKWHPLQPRPDNDIRQINLDDLKKILARDAGDKRPLLLNFWATWCDPCREEFPDLVKLDADYKDKGLNFIAVSLDDITDIKSEVPKFLNQMKATMPVVLLNVSDPEPAIKAVDPTWSGELPATFLYGADGKIIFKHFGKIKPDELRAAIDKQLASKSQ
jgi:thiol-disulfide isomerase/thioredoxin